MKLDSDEICRYLKRFFQAYFFIREAEGKISQRESKQ